MVTTEDYFLNADSFQKISRNSGESRCGCGDPSLDRYRVMQQNENPASQAATPSARHNLSRGGGDAGATRGRSARSCTSRPWPELRACRQVHTHRRKPDRPEGKRSGNKVEPAWEALGARGVRQASQRLGGWSWPMGTCQGPHLIGLPIAESTQATDPTSARILAAKRLSLSSPTSR